MQETEVKYTFVIESRTRKSKDWTKNENIKSNDRHLN